MEDAVEGYRRVRGPAGLLTGAGRHVDLPGDVERAAGNWTGSAPPWRTLSAWRAAPPDRRAAEPAAGPGRRTARTPREITRAGIVPALRDHTHDLIGKGLPLRSVAARLSALSARTAPVGSAARLARLDALCGPERPRRPTARHPFLAGGPRPAAFAVTGVLALLAGVWPVLGWASGPPSASSPPGSPI